MYDGGWVWVWERMLMLMQERTDRTEGAFYKHTKNHTLCELRFCLLHVLMSGAVRCGRKPGPHNLTWIVGARPNCTT